MMSGRRLSVRGSGDGNPGGQQQRLCDWNRWMEMRQATTHPQMSFKIVLCLNLHSSECFGTVVQDVPLCFSEVAEGTLVIGWQNPAQHVGYEVKSVDSSLSTELKNSVGVRYDQNTLWCLVWKDENEQRMMGCSAAYLLNLKSLCIGLSKGKV